MKSFPAFGILLASRSQRGALLSLLEKNSGLPGPRANLELMYSFARAVSSLKLQEWQWELIVQMASISPSKAPVNTPREYLSVCGVAAMGALYAAGLPRPRRRAALAAIRRAASDSRWRTREAAAIALQIIGEQDRDALREIVETWSPDASLLEKRAIVAGLAHPPLLKDEAFSRFCLEVSRTILASLQHLDAAVRRSNEFRVLRQGLGYAISVFVHKRPEEGFSLLLNAAGQKDPDIRWIVRENLKKKRLWENYPEEVERISRLAGG